MNNRLLRAFALIAVALLASTSSLGAVEHQHTCRYCQSGRHGIDFHTTPEEGQRQYAPDRQVDVLHIKLDVTPNFNKQTVAGTATIRFTPIAKPLTSLRLDAVNLKIAEVNSSHHMRHPAYANDGKNLTILFADPILPGQEASVEIAYSAEPKLGLFFRTPAMGFPATDTHCWTQGETHEARHWFPCFDYPNERASTEIICHVPSDMTVVANGRLVGETPDAGGRTKAVHWLQEKSHVSYLICMVAGHLTKLEAQHRGIPLAFYTQPSLAEHAPNSFQDTPAIMAFFEEEIGVPYPWDKYAQATCADYSWGGMENTTITTLTQRTVYSAATENVRTSHSLDAHEMAHQWFGDYVTCKDWSHLWLNEGFATYYALLYDGKKYGPEATQYGLYLDARDDIFPQAKDRRPIVYRKYNVPDEQFDFRNYPKASWVLHMLRSQVGVDLYRQAIQKYLKRHALGDVETDDLREVFEELSGKPLDKFFDQWLYHGGFPELKISYKWLPEEKLAHVTIEQTQTTGDDVLLFELPTRLQFVVDGKPVDEKITIDGRRHDFYVQLPAEPQMVLFDPDYTLLAKVTFDKSDAMLLAELKHPTSAMARVFACEGLAKSKSTDAVTALKEALQNDAFYGVRSAAATALRKIRTDEAIAALAASTSQPDARIRWRVVEELGKSYREAGRKKLLEVVASEKNPAIIGAAVRGLGSFQGKESSDAALKALQTESFTNDEMAGAFAAIRSLNAAALAPELIKVLQARVNEIDQRDLSEGMVTLAKISQKPKRRDEAYHALVGFMNSPRELVRTHAMKALGELKDSRARELLEPLVTDDPLDPVSIVAKAALAALDKEATLVPAEVSKLRKEVRDLRESQEKLEKSLKELKDKKDAEQKPAA